MVSSTTLAIMMTVYVIFCFAIMYYCMLADPHSSGLAKYFQVILPNRAWRVLAQICGQHKMHFLQHLMDRALVLIYFLVVGGSWSIVFWYLYPWLYRSPGVSNLHGIFGILVFVACFISWAVANSSHPGQITARTFPKYDHYPYDNLLFLSNKRCETTHLPRIPRSKYDRIKYHAIVPRYDHFCGWTYNTYGEENYRWFILFLVQHVMMCFYGSYVTILLFYNEVKSRKLFDLTFFDRVTGETIDANYYIIVQYLFARKTLECCVLCVMFVMGIALSCFLGYHMYLTSNGQTTNENMKWDDVKHWYKQQQKKYREAIKDGKIKSKATPSPSSPAIADITAGKVLDNDDENDVTCTPGSQQQQSRLKADNDEYFDPGPIPNNIYDRGFIENWKEVFVPISQRKNALQLGGYTKMKLMLNNPKAAVTTTTTIPSQGTSIGEKPEISPTGNKPKDT